MEEQFPEQESSAAALEGTEAHDLLERAVKARTGPSTLEPEHHACKDVDLMYDMVSPFLDNPRYVVLSEVEVHLCDDVYGTADIIIIDLQELQLAVWDYKHGRGVLVEVPAIQLDIYGAAALKSLSYLFPASMKRVVTGIVQPRAEHINGPVRQTECSAEEMTAKGEEVIAIAKKINNNEVCLVPSEGACRWCRAKKECGACADAALKACGFGPIEAKDAAAPTEEAMVPGPAIAANDLTVHERIAIHEARGFITDFLNAVSLGLEQDILAGQDIPGMKVVAGRSIRKFDPDLSEEEIIKVLKGDCKLKPSQFSPPKLVTGPQALKLIDPKKRGGKKKLEALNAIIVKPQGKPIVVAEDDPRDSIAPHFKPVNTDIDPLG